MLEEMLHAQGREWARLSLEENLRLRAQLEQRRGVTGADGVERTTVRDSERLRISRDVITRFTAT